jgi:hypothetical protein
MVEHFLLHGELAWVWRLSFFSLGKLLPIVNFIKKLIIYEFFNPFHLLKFCFGKGLNPRVLS